MRELRLAVQGSRRCVREVTGRLRDVPGVNTVAADVSTRTVRLAGSMTDADVLAAFSGTTYVAQSRVCHSGHFPPIRAFAADGVESDASTQALPTRERSRVR